MGERHIKSDEEYAGIVKSMHKDLQRTEREREIEAAFGDSMPDILSHLDTECDGNRSAMCRRINDKLRDSPKVRDDVKDLSRGTLYNYIDKYGV